MEAMPDATAIAQVPDKLKAAAGDRKVQVIAGVGLIAFGLGIYLGMKIKGPHDWVPPYELSPVPCAGCAEKSARPITQAVADAVGGTVVNPGGRQLTADDLRALAEVIKADGPVVWSPLAGAPADMVEAAAVNGDTPGD